MIFRVKSIPQVFQKFIYELSLFVVSLGVLPQFLSFQGLIYLISRGSLPFSLYYPLDFALVVYVVLGFRSIQSPVVYVFILQQLLGFLRILSLQVAFGINRVLYQLPISRRYISVYLISPILKLQISRLIELVGVSLSYLNESLINYPIYILGYRESDNK